MLVVCTVIFIAVFGVMFYSIIKHRKSKGARRQLPREHDGRDRLDGRAVHHRHPDGAAGDARRRRDEGHLGGRPDDQGHRHPVEVGLRLPQRRGRGHRLPVDARRRAARDVRLRPAAGRRLPAQGRQPARRSGRQEGAHHHDRERRDPRLGRAVARRQAGRDPRLRARHLVPRRQAGRLLRPVLRALRQGARVHADPRQGGLAGRLHRLGRAARSRKRRPRPTTRARSGSWPALVARGEQIYTANCQVCHQAERQGRRHDQGARRLADGARRRQDQADPRAC